jgi:hypothetical protein
LMWAPVTGLIASFLCIPISIILESRTKHRITQQIAPPDANSWRR